MGSYAWRQQHPVNVITLGVNYYAVGHDAKWQFNYAMIDSDDDSLDGDYLGIGLTVGV